MTDVLQVYKCMVCGNIVEVLHAGKGQLVCCGKPMVLMEAKKEDAGKEKHVPVVEYREGKTAVKIGEVEHPMEEEHYIEWIEVVSEDGVCRKHLKPGDKPEVEFEGKFNKVRIYCNVHGLWER